MKSKRRRLGTKARIGAKREGGRRIVKAIFATLILVTIMLSGYFSYQLFSPAFQGGKTLFEPTRQFKPSNPNPEFKAAIVDQLSLTFPNETFVEEAAAILTNVGYTVDYFSGEKVTVEFYRNLPAYGYKIIILRVHTTGHGAFFTSEGYSKSSYVWEQLNDQIWRVSYDGNPPFYFGISPSFVKSCMNGRFNEAVIIAMGCTTLQFDDMAKAFIEKGAKVYIGWTGLVSASHTDAAITHLLQHLLLEKHPIKYAIRQTMDDVGPEPLSKVGSTLSALPEKSWDYTIQIP